MERRLDELTSRVDDLEEWQAKRDIENARIEERRTANSERLGRAESRLDKIEGHVGKLVWLVLASVVSGFVAFVFRNGLG